ncbi:unnamed protein product [Merluccius merluccius]
MIVLFGQDTHPQKYMLPRSPGGWFVTRPIPPVSSALLDATVTQFRGGRNNATSGTVICQDLRLKVPPGDPEPPTYDDAYPDPESCDIDMISRCAAVQFTANPPACELPTYDAAAFDFEDSQLYE